MRIPGHRLKLYKQPTYLLFLRKVQAPSTGQICSIILVDTLYLGTEQFYYNNEILLSYLVCLIGFDSIRNVCIQVI